MKKILSLAALSLTFGLGIVLLTCGVLGAASAKSEGSSVQLKEVIRVLHAPPLSNYVEQQVVAKRPTKVIILHKNNTLSIRSVITSQQESELEIQLLDMSHKLPKNATIYLVLDTPGGDVMAGSHFIDIAHSIPQKIDTITVFAASMGFQTAQQLGERLILPTGTLMSHRAAVDGIGGQVPGNAVTRLNYIRRQIYNMELITSARMGLDIKSYRDLVRDEYWVSGQDAVAQKAADSVVLANCGSDMMGTTTMQVQTFLGALDVEMSRCPLIDGILSVHSSSGFAERSKDYPKVVSFLNEMFTNRTKFIDEEIITGHYHKYLP